MHYSRLALQGHPRTLAQSRVLALGAIPVIVLWQALAVFAVLVVGPPGAGKTSVLKALHDALADEGVVHAAVEVEALSWRHPPLTGEQELRQVETIREAYEQTGVELFLWGATATSQDHLDSLLAAIAADEHFVVRLEADPATLRARIVDREPAGWSGLDRLVAVSEELALQSETFDRVDLAVSTQGTSPSAVAERIRAALPKRVRSN